MGRCVVSVADDASVSKEDLDLGIAPSGDGLDLQFEANLAYHYEVFHAENLTGEWESHSEINGGWGDGFFACLATRNSYRDNARPISLGE